MSFRNLIASLFSKSNRHHEVDEVNASEPTQEDFQIARSLLDDLAANAVFGALGNPTP